MAVSAADHYEVRWRVKNADAAWGSPRTCPALDEIVVEELDRTQQYEFEVRAVSNCGAKSIWVGSDYTVPGAVPPTSIDTLTAQSLADGVHLGWTSIATPAAGIESSIERSANGTTGWAERARVRSTAYTDPETSGTTYYYRVRYVNFAGQFGAYSPVASSNGVNVGSIGTNATNALADAAAAQADADAANAALADIASDNLLTPGEKPVVIRDYNVIITEQAGIDAQATAYAITTEKTAYDTAVSALTTYLATLTTPVLWSNLTGNTTIVGATFRSKFADVYTTRQTLLNAIYAAAKAKADAAQATANTATGQVSQLPVINGGFDIAPTGYGWVPDAGSGWFTDTTGVTPGVGPNCGRHTGGVGASTGAYRNSGLAPCGPGQVYKTQALIKASGANGSCYVFISWCDAGGNEIGSKPGNGITGTTTNGSYAIGTAPAGTVYARTCTAVTGHTTGYYAVDNVVCTQYPSSLDDVPDGASKFSSIYTPNIQTGIYQPGGNLLRNPTAALGNLYWASTIGVGLLTRPANFFPGLAASSDPCWQATTSGADQGQLSDLITIPAGTPLVLSADMLMVSVTSGYVAVGLSFLDSSGTEIAPRQQINAVAGGWATYSLAYTTPTGCATVQVFPRGTPTGGTALWRRIKLEVGTVGTPFNDLATQSGNQLVNPGSGYTLGNQLNAPNSLTMAYGSVRSSTALTATSAGAVSVNAFTAYLGGTAVSYNAVSNAVTGLTVNSTYQIYCHDPGGTGGTKTWFAATSVQAAMQQGDDVVLGGAVTIPSTGSSGGGGSGGCPVREAWVVRRAMGGEEEIKAGEVRVGDRLKIINPVTGAVRWGLVSMSKPAYVACVRVVQRGGISLSCSATAPLGASDGAAVLAPGALGKVITGMDAAAVVRDEVTHVRPIGKCWVQHITCEDDFFLAGDQSGRYLAHHNLKP